MDATLANFRALFPEFAPVTDPRAQLFLDLAAEELSAPAWGVKYGEAALTFAAHLLSLSETRGASATSSASGAVLVPQAGAIQSATAENLTVAFAASVRGKSANEEWLSQTPFGQAFAALRRRVLARGRLSW